MGKFQNRFGLNLEGKLAGLEIRLVDFRWYLDEPKIDLRVIHKPCVHGTGKGRGRNDKKTGLLLKKFLKSFDIVSYYVFKISLHCIPSSRCNLDIPGAALLAGWGTYLRKAWNIFSLFCWLFKVLLLIK